MVIHIYFVEKLLEATIDIFVLLLVVLSAAALQLC